MDFIRQNYRVSIAHVERLVREHGYMGAAEILSEQIGQNIDNTYCAGILYALGLREKSYDEYELLTKYSYMFNERVLEFMLEHYDALSEMIDHDMDYCYKYSSIKDLAKNYALKVGGKPVEQLQWALMRAAVEVASPYDWQEPTLDEVYCTYNMFSRRWAIHGTPTMVNAGCKDPQLESCFKIDVGDSMESIADSLKLVLLASKKNGGIGLHVGRIRHSRVANRGITKGVPGVLRLFNSVISYADQLGSRPGALTAFLPVHHYDIETFIKMGNPHSAPDIQCTNIHYAVTIPDLFMKRVSEKGKWSLFCPREVQVLWCKLQNKGEVYDSKEIDRAPTLSDFTGEEFEKFYIQCEEAGIAKKVINAYDLEMEMQKERCLHGRPFRVYIDNANRKSNHSHLGPITQSNLCMEIMQYTKAQEIVATCDLATINLACMVDPSKKGINGVRWDRIGMVTRQLTRNLNRVLDRTSGILPEGMDPTHTARQQNRAIGIGVMGYASMLVSLGLVYGSKEAVDLAARIRACIYWHSMDESADLAQIEGSYPTFEGSPVSKGILQPDMWIQESSHMKQYETDECKRYEYGYIHPSEFGVQSTWDDLRIKCMKGMRNSLTTTQPPNVTTASVFGVPGGTEPFYEIMYSTTNINGTDQNIYDVFREIMIENDLYKPVEMAKYLINNDGRVNGMYKLFDDPQQRQKCREIESLFVNAWSVNKKKYIMLYQRMGYYVDQSQSLNIFYDKPNAEYLMKLSRLAWINGCKTEYYLRRLAKAENIGASSLMQSSVKKGVEGECTSCQ